MSARLAGGRIVPLAKVTGYLLDADHPDGAAKAAFFFRFGFAPSTPDALVSALSDHPDLHPIASERVTGHGVLRTVECSVPTPDGRDPCIRTVWVLEPGSSTHRFVTAYPA